PPSPGCALGVYQNDQIGTPVSPLFSPLTPLCAVYSKGYGIANLEYNQRIQPSSVFRIASFSKQFTAMCIALLVMDGKLSVDEKIVTYFPQLTRARDVTVYHMIHHLSGLVDYFALLNQSACVVYDACVTVKGILDLLAPAPLDFPAGIALPPPFFVL